MKMLVEMTLKELQALPEHDTIRDGYGLTPLVTQNDPIMFPDNNGLLWRPVYANGEWMRELLNL